MTLLQKFTSILRSDDKKDDKPDERKVPSGFEKILKRTKRAIQHNKKDEPSSKNKDDKEEETDHNDKEDEPKKKKKATETSSSSSIQSFFMDPNGGPNYDNLLKLFLISGIAGYYAWIQSRSSEEITYQSFVQEFLAQN